MTMRPASPNPGFFSRPAALEPAGIRAGAPSSGVQPIHRRLAAWLVSGIAASALLLAGCPKPQPAMPSLPPVVSQPVLVLTPPPPFTPPPTPAISTIPAPAPPAVQPARRRHSTPHRPSHVSPRSARPLTPPPPPPKPSPQPAPLQLSAGLSPQQQVAYRRDALAWIASSRNYLASLPPRHLNASQRANRLQAQEYIQQAQAALKRGDVERARSLAYKAMLLAQALR